MRISDFELRISFSLKLESENYLKTNNVSLEPHKILLNSKSEIRNPQSESLFLICEICGGLVCQGVGAFRDFL